MNRENHDIILDSIGKAKGVLMPNKNEETNIPQIVGLNKLQLFLLITSAVLVGAAAFGLGFLFHQNQDKINNQDYKITLQNKYQIGITSKNNIATSPIITSKEQDYDIKKHTFILIGRFKTIEESKNMQNKIQIKSGKLPSIKQTNDGFFLFIGPFESESLARNERNLIYQKTSVLGSLLQDV